MYNESDYFNSLRFEIFKDKSNQQIYNLQYGNPEDTGSTILRCMNNNLIQLRDKLNSLSLGDNIDEKELDRASCLSPISIEISLYNIVNNMKLKKSNEKDVYKDKIKFISMLNLDQKRFLIDIYDKI